MAEPEARLAVLPGTHMLPIEHPDLVDPLFVSFLRNTDPPPDWNAFTGVAENAIDGPQPAGAKACPCH